MSVTLSFQKIMSVLIHIRADLFSGKMQFTAGLQTGKSRPLLNCQAIKREVLRFKLQHPLQVPAKIFTGLARDTENQVDADILETGLPRPGQTVYHVGLRMEATESF